MAPDELVSGWATVTRVQRTWLDTPMVRIEVLGLLQTLNGELLSHDSATLTLDRWCASHGLAADARPARIVAERVQGPAKRADAEQRRRLQVGPDEELRYRRVHLRCGALVLSEADNWYVPGRLTPAINRQLETSDTPFGRAVAGLDFHRQTVSARFLWLPLTDGGEIGAPAGGPATGGPATGGGALAIPHALIRHEAVLSLPDGTPFSDVIETYTSAVLAFPAPLSPPPQ